MKSFFILKQVLYIILLIMISQMTSTKMKIKSTTNEKTRENLNNPNLGCTISLKKTKDDKLQSISFISEMQNSLNHYSTCKLILKKILLKIFF